VPTLITVIVVPKRYLVPDYSPRQTKEKNTEKKSDENNSSNESVNGGQQN